MQPTTDINMKIMIVNIFFILSVVVVMKIECSQNDSQLGNPDERLTETNNLTDQTIRLTNNKTNLNYRTNSSSTTNVFLIVLLVMVLICCCVSLSNKH